MTRLLLLGFASLAGLGLWLARRHREPRQPETHRLRDHQWCVPHEHVETNMARWHRNQARSLARAAAGGHREPAPFDHWYPIPEVGRETWCVLDTSGRFDRVVRSGMTEAQARALSGKPSHYPEDSDGVQGDSGLLERLR